MPEPVEKPAKAPRKRAAQSEAAKIEELKQKYRLDAEVNLNVRGKDGIRLGKGPLLDPQVIEKFASLDNTKNKRYLDWMLFQAGGGSQAFKHSQEMWGDGTPEKTPEEFFSKFKSEKPDQSVRYDELRLLAQKLKEKGYDITPLANGHSDEVEEATRLPEPHERFKALVQLIKQQGLVPGKEERIALEIISNKFKLWIKNQLQTKTRDRVHATFVYSCLIRGISPDKAEESWRAMEPRRRREYLFGDQDALKWESFGYARHWPGRNNIYDLIYNTMRQFIQNVERLERQQQRIDAYNAHANQRNVTLPPDQQIPHKQPISIQIDIGKVTVDSQGNLAYKGAYPTVASLAKANEEIADLPIRGRVEADVRYAGPKGSRSNKATVYSDENLDVLVPLTVAAAIRSGNPAWEISDPKQLSNIRSQGNYSPSAWTNYAAGRHGHMEWADTQAIPVIFRIKTPGLVPELSQLLMTVFLGDLVELQAPYVGTVWRTGGSNQKKSFTDVMRELKNGIRLPPEDQVPEDSPYRDTKSAYLGLIKSITRAMNTIKEWGKEFDPQDVVGDYIKHHRERTQGKRTLGEEVKIRAAHVVEALLE